MHIYMGCARVGSIGSASAATVAAAAIEAARFARRLSALLPVPPRSLPEPLPLAGRA